MSDTKAKSINGVRIHVHLCSCCGKVSKRDEPDGSPDSMGAFQCSTCGHVGLLNLLIVEETDPRLQH